MPTALFSLSDKTNLIDLARTLLNLGWDFLASGGTAAFLRGEGMPVTEISAYTGSPEILNGRVKTIHPAVSGGILARNSPEDEADLVRINARFIDLVCCNLYPFQNVIASPGTTLESAIKNIDIGGATLIRSAAKNYQRVFVLTDPNDYTPFIDQLDQNKETSLRFRKTLSIKAFSYTAKYDTAISNYLSGMDLLTLQFYPQQHLRYGENWHQDGMLFSQKPDSGHLGGTFLQGKPLSYNNLLDLDSAFRAAISFQEPTVVIVKHLSPCGIASANTLDQAFPLAYQSDPVSAFGSVIAVNRKFDLSIAEALGDLFVECIVAPEFSDQALDFLSPNVNLRLVEAPGQTDESIYEYRSITGGFLRQTIDYGDPPGTNWKAVTQREPTPDEWSDLRFAWLACQHVKSNAIVFAKGRATIGIGGGQPNRIDCVEIAAKRAGQNNLGAVMASDAFFPYPDSVQAAARYGITAIIQPGGSKRDTLSIQACNENNIAMVFTGVRHFRH